MHQPNTDGLSLWAALIGDSREILVTQVQIVEFNASTPMEDQLRIIAGTGVFVSVHTSNLANAHFLQPGSAVFEIIQQNWFWAGLDLTFKVSKMLDILLKVQTTLRFLPRTNLGCLGPRPLERIRQKIFS